MARFRGVLTKTHRDGTHDSTNLVVTAGDAH
jgi:hypothetical protein